MAGLNRTQIEDEVAKVISGDRKEAKAAVAAVVESIQRTLIAGERVHITGIGSLNSKQVPSRMVRNPATHKKVRAKKTARVTLKPSEELKDLICGRKKLGAKKRKTTQKK